MFTRSFLKPVVAALAVSTSALFGGSITVGVNNGGNGFPFGASGTPGNRYQEAYSSSLFSGPITITGIDFFRSGVNGTLWGGTFLLSLSTISANVNSLSNVFFNSNLGANNALFASMTLSGAAPAVLSFTGGPFLYDPSQGNLLLDISIANLANNSPSAAFEDENGSGPPTIARYQNFGFGTVGYGLVTQFDAGAVATPEPGTLGLLGVALIGMAGWRLRRVSYRLARGKKRIEGDSPCP